MKTNLSKDFLTDKDAETQGNWFKISPGVRFLIKRLGGANAQKLREADAKHRQPYIKKIQAGVLTDEEIELITLKAFIECAIVNWEGVKDEDGNDIPFTFDNAVKVLQPIPDLVNTLLSYASNYQNFLEDVGNI